MRLGHLFQTTGPGSALLHLRWLRGAMLMPVQDREPPERGLACALCCFTRGPASTCPLWAPAHTPGFLPLDPPWAVLLGSEEVEERGTRPIKQ